MKTTASFLGLLVLLFLGGSCKNELPKQEKAPGAADDISCLGSPNFFEPESSAISYEVNDLPTGSYHYQSGDAFYETSHKSLGLHSRESLTSSSPGMIQLGSEFVCRSGFQANRQAAFFANAHGPRTIRIRGVETDVIFREYTLKSEEGAPGFECRDGESLYAASKNQMSERLSKEFREHSFYRTSLSTYRFIGVKDIPGGATIRLNIQYIFNDLDAQTDEGVFVPFPHTLF
jgi:hypothetical protein